MSFDIRAFHVAVTTALFLIASVDAQIPEQALSVEASFPLHLTSSPATN